MAPKRAAPVPVRGNKSILSFFSALSTTSVNESQPSPGKKLEQEELSMDSLGRTGSKIDTSVSSDEDNAVADVFDASEDSQVDGIRTTRVRRFNGSFRVVVNEYGQEPASVVVLARSSSHAPKSWHQGREFLSEGMPIFAEKLFRTFEEDNKGIENLAGVFLAMYDIHTRYVPTGEHCEAHKVQDPSMKSYLSRAFKFTDAIDKELNSIAIASPDRARYLLSVGLDGFACVADLFLAWLKRTPPFILVIRETELCYGMKEEFFPMSSQGLYYGFFDSQDLEKSIESGLSTDKAIENLLEAWAKCQAWKDDISTKNNGRTIGRNGDHKAIPTRAKRGPSRGPTMPK
ncbi:hypothetical protein N0V83_007127 [Neocucurbitaria cava]|uniref:Uncharacterized protein n=1 Tax=Neocucurbitaria cava TaxID=798079 RepID=A0A9W9CK02_9PLEO|nr:hypothetical protein N0V83_007127 [Neocucurbitaria cava]